VSGRTNDTIFKAELKSRIERRKRRLEALSARLRIVCSDPIRFEALRKIVGEKSLSIFRKDGIDEGN